MVITRYYCTHLALRSLAACEAVPPLRFDEHGVIAAGTSARGRGGSRLRNLRRNVDHTVGANAFFTHLTRDAGNAGHDLPRWWSEAEATQRFRHRDRVYWIRPDGAGIYYLGERCVPFLLEYDRGTMRRRDYLRKLAGISAYFESASYRSFFGREPVVLVVAEHDDGEGRFVRAACEGLDHFGVVLPMLFTAKWRFEHDARNARGTLGPIWRSLDSPLRRGWLEVQDGGQP